MFCLPACLVALLALQWKFVQRERCFAHCWHPSWVQRVPDILGSLSREMLYIGSPSTGLGVWHNCCKDFNLTPFLCLLSPLQSPKLKDWEWLDCDKAAADFLTDEAEGSFLAGQPYQSEIIAHGSFSGQNLPLVMVEIGCSCEDTSPALPRPDLPWDWPPLRSLISCLLCLCPWWGCTQMHKPEPSCWIYWTYL